MKIRLLYSLILFSVFSVTEAFGQKDKQYLPLSFGGLVIEKSYTHEQIIEIMGKPDSVQVHINDPSFESNDVRIYYYNSNLFYLTEGKLDVLEINKTGLKINGIAGVGDKADTIYKLPHHEINVTKHGEKTFFELFFRGYDFDMSSMLFTVNNGIITRIQFCYIDNI